MIEIIQGDNLDAMREIPIGSVHLVYMDPPFGTGKKRVGKSGSFSDPCKGKYFNQLEQRIGWAWRLLAPEGCLVVHVDSHMSHHIKAAMDALLGADYFASEIIWRYRRWPSKTPNFQRVHDVLLRYVKIPGNSRWNQLYEPLSESTLKTWGDKKQLAVVEDGRRTRSSSTKEASPGVPMGDVWDISIIAPSSKERTGYPTQKPEALLERLILSCTNASDLVVDPYCGSGTTLAVCKRLGRRCIGIDENPEAIEVTRRRLEAIHA
jgi:DNA modification methylase